MPVQLPPLPPVEGIDFVQSVVDAPILRKAGTYALPPAASSIPFEVSPGKQSQQLTVALNLSLADKLSVGKRINWSVSYGPTVNGPFTFAFGGGVITDGIVRPDPTIAQNTLDQRVGQFIQVTLDFGDDITVGETIRIDGVTPDVAVSPALDVR